MIQVSNFADLLKAKYGLVWECEAPRACKYGELVPPGKLPPGTQREDPGDSWDSSPGGQAQRGTAAAAETA